MKGVKMKKIRNNIVKAIIFDIGGVLQLGRYSLNLKERHLGVHEYLAKNLGMDLDSWYDSIDTPYSDSIMGKIDKRKVIKIISENLEIDRKKLENLFIKAYKRFFKKNNELYNLADKLKKKGYIVGILSDQWPLSKKALVPKEDVKGFYPVIISCDVGVRKPNLKIYNLLLKKLRKRYKNIKANEVLFIDNRRWNLRPAEKMGIKVILFEDNVHLIKELKKMEIIW